MDSYDVAVIGKRGRLHSRATRNLAVPKSNWANPIDTGPFVAYAVPCGITCTFAGVKVNTQGQILNDNDQPLPGLYATGEMVG